MHELSSQLRFCVLLLLHLLRLLRTAVEVHMLRARGAVLRYRQYARLTIMGCGLEVAVLQVEDGPQDAALNVQATHDGISDNVVTTRCKPHADVRHHSGLDDVPPYSCHSMRFYTLCAPLKSLGVIPLGPPLAAGEGGRHGVPSRRGWASMLFQSDCGEASSCALFDLRYDCVQWPGVRAARWGFVECQRKWMTFTAWYVPDYDQHCWGLPA